MAELKLDRDYSREEYFQLEESDLQTRYEYVDGRIYAMAGGTIRHGMLISNTLYWVREELRKAGKSCKTFSGDVKVEISEVNSFLYPDVFVFCGKIEELNEAELVIEVLSKSTQNYDQTHTFRLYRSLKSLKEYALIYQDQAIIESFTRISDDSWQIRNYLGLDKIYESASMGIQIPMQKIYEDVLS